VFYTGISGIWWLALLSAVNSSMMCMSCRSHMGNLSPCRSLHMRTTCTLHSTVHGDSVKAFTVLGNIRLHLLHRRIKHISTITDTNCKARSDGKFVEEHTTEHTAHARFGVLLQTPVHAWPWKKGSTDM